MCGRYTQTAPYPKLADRFGLPAKGPKIAARYNIAPTQDVPVIINDGGPRLEIMHWGLVPHWAKDQKIGYKMINARAETLREKPSFRGSLKSRRCIVPAAGFFEWARGPKATSKTPMYISAADGELLGLAGLWDEWKAPDGHLLHSFTIITTEANDLLKPIHYRMPAILDQKDEETWIADGELTTNPLEEVLKPCPEEKLRAHPVGTLVNSPKNNIPDCISPA